MVKRAVRVPQWRSVALGLTLLLVLVIAGINGVFRTFEAEAWVRQIEDTIVAWGSWGVMVSMGIMVLHSFVPFPAEFVAIANGMLYGSILGTAITWSGAMLGAMLAFALSRSLGRRFVEVMLARRHLAWLDTWSGEKAANWIFLARFVPIVAFNLVNYAAGLTKISWWTFIWTTAIGILPMTALMVSMGASAHHLEWQWWLALMTGGFIAWLILRRWFPGAGVDARAVEGREGN